MDSPVRLSQSRLLSAITDLETALSGLPDRVDAAYYRILGGVLDFRMPGLYRAYDAYASAALQADGRAVTCRRGCAACCRHFVDSVEPFEIAHIHLALRGREDYPDILVALHRRTALLERIRAGESGIANPEEAEDRSLHRYFLRGVPCPMLDAGGSCGIYERRPMSCRMFFAESSPRFCAGSAIASPWNKNFQVELPEDVERALSRCARTLSALQISEGLFPGLLAVNEVFGRYDGEDRPHSSNKERLQASKVPA